MHIEKGLIFTGQWFTGKVEVIEVKEETNELKVKLQSKVDAKETDSHWFETWNLKQTSYGFDRADYFLIDRTMRSIKQILEEVEKSDTLKDLVYLWNEIAINKKKYPLIEINSANKVIRERCLSVEGSDIDKGKFFHALKAMDKS